MQLSGKAIGIWGYGIGGKATAEFVASHGAHVVIFDERPLTPQEQQRLTELNAHICTSRDAFFEQSELIIPSAGIDLRSYHTRKNQFITELDLFSLFFTKPIIAITGSLGKTTTTTLIATLLQRAGKRVLIGGNIGIGMCDLIAQQENVDFAVLEVSSFQLEACQYFHPHGAVWTNFYPNHLDRHASMDEYFAAKSKILANQQQADWIILPDSVYEKLLTVGPIKSRTILIPAQTPPEWEAFIARQAGFVSNWVVALSVLQALGISLDAQQDTIDCVIEHRLEPVATLNGVTFYNDSKSTITQATLAAVARCAPCPVVLLLGGLSKGVDRQPLVKALIGTSVSHVICFGAESEKLAGWLQQEDIPHSICAHFDEIVIMAYTYAKQNGGAVLLSPGGSSFDLFKNYQERGTRFKELVFQLRSTQ